MQSRSISIERVTGLDVSADGCVPGMHKLQSNLVLRPLSLGSEIARNRLGLAPINTGLIDQDGLPTGQFEQFHKTYSAAGVGIVFIGGVSISQSGRASLRSFVLDSEVKAASLRPTVEAIRRNGALPIAQLMHAGRQSRLPVARGLPVAASALPCPIVGVTPRALTTDEIRGVVLDFQMAANCAVSSGIRVVEVHAAHGYLVSGFLSPFSNTRTDGYGGSQQNRYRFLAEILEEVTAIQGISVGVRISADEFVTGGLKASDAPDLVHRLLGSGVAFISVSAGVYSTDDRIMPSRHLGEGVYRHLGAAVKSIATVPVMLAGNVTTLESARSILEASDADVILMARALLSDRALLAKSLEGNAEFVIPCTMCRLCKYTSRRLPHVVCPHNPELKAILAANIRSARAGGVPIRAVPLPDPHC